jgi:hypothetical protein
MKLWDIRNVKSPVNVWNGLPNFSAHTDCILSPDEKYIVTGISAKPGSGNRAGLLFYHSDTFELARVTDFDSSVLRILWHEKLNQIITSCADNTIHVLFDPKCSEKGALLTISKPIPKKDLSDDIELGVGNIWLPPDEDLLHTEVPVAKQLRRIKKEELRQQKKLHGKNPEIPPSKIGTGGKVGTSTTQFLLRNMGIIKPEMEEDPREALLKYESKAKGL